jgi:hypothetical protein
MQSTPRLSWSTLGLVALAATGSALLPTQAGCAASGDDAGGSTIIVRHDGGDASDANHSSDAVDPGAPEDGEDAGPPGTPPAPSPTGSGADASVAPPAPSSPPDDASSPTPSPTPTPTPTPTPSSDAGAGFTHDASSGYDAGHTSYDAGHATYDSGHASYDSGATAYDAGTTAADSGTTSHDTGTSAADSGAPDVSVVDVGGSSSLPPTAAELLALTTTCSVASNGKYATDSGATPTVDICALTGAYFWKADMDIDCDGLKTAVCSASTDPAYQNQTSATTSTGGWLDASTLPYVVIPLPSSRFDYTKSNIQLGQLVAVIYNGKITYGVFGDEGPSDIIGESSYAMAQSLGIDPNPATGGVDSGVTYIVFTGPGAVVSPIEDHAKAVALGQTLANKLLGR